jgi:hypothetical protein
MMYIIEWAVVQFTNVYMRMITWSVLHDVSIQNGEMNAGRTKVVVWKIEQLQPDQQY